MLLVQKPEKGPKVCSQKAIPEVVHASSLQGTSAANSSLKPAPPRTTGRYREWKIVSRIIRISEIGDVAV